MLQRESGAAARIAERRARWSGGRTSFAEAADQDVVFWQQVPGGAWMPSGRWRWSGMEQPNLPQDFVDLLEAFGRADIRYLIDARNLERGRPDDPTQR